MKIVLVTSGPRGGGKTTFVEKIKKDQPDTPLVSRDNIRIQLFGKVGLNPYTDNAEIAFARMSEVLRTYLYKEEPSNVIILDCWNGYSGERKNIIKMARCCGADEVHCLQFFLPIDTCVKWFAQKAYTGGITESSVRSDYALYYKTAEDIENDGFDSVIPINPCQLRFKDMPFS